MMNDHLSQVQISQCIAGVAMPDEQRHGRECPECRALIVQFQETVSLFRTAMKDSSDRESVPRVSDIQTFLRGATRNLQPHWRWAAVGLAVMVLTAISIHRWETVLIRQMKADEAVRVMSAVNTHLSRTIPAPMEPVMALIPLGRLTTYSGAIQ